MSETVKSDEPDRDDQRFAQNMAIIREQRGLSQADLVRVLKQQGWSSVYQTTISRIEKGDRPVRYGEARAIARALGVSVDRFLLSAAESTTAGRLSYARARLEDAHRAIRENATEWWRLREKLAGIVDETLEAGIEPTELPEDTDTTIVPTRLEDELALAIEALEKRTPESATRTAQIFYDVNPQASNASTT